MVPPAVDIEALLGSRTVGTTPFEHWRTLAHRMLAYFRELVPVLLPLAAHPEFDFESALERSPDSPLGRIRAGLMQYLRAEAAADHCRPEAVRVPVQQLTEGEVVKLCVERKHLTDLLKMVAYQAESDLVRLITPHYRRAEDEGRTLVQSALASAGNIALDGNELRIALEPLSSPHGSHAVAALCEQLNRTPTRFPGSKLRLRIEVKPPPEICSAFPGPRADGGPASPIRSPTPK